MKNEYGYLDYEQQKEAYMSDIISLMEDCEDIKILIQIKEILEENI